MSSTMYQVATLQSLMTGYTRAVITVDDLMKHGDTGLGTFEDVNGEMIVCGGHCYKAADDGSVTEADPEEGVPFASVAFVGYGSDIIKTFDLDNIPDIDAMKAELDRRIEEWFGLNSMHVVRIDGSFRKIAARSEAPLRTQHISLKQILSGTQRSFEFDDVEGSMVCVYYPDYMKGINAPGWHLHFLSKDRSLGGHVFDLEMIRGTASMVKLSSIEIQLPTAPAFDTYSLADDSSDDIKTVEQGKK
ncbi:MAG: acetolactate decarboxylase [Eubacterium sp.]|nr:acetolactate decarboxylase [Eubacterium sp.]